MIVFPIAKINLGLNVVERRPDGYHNLETVFFPVELKDALEVQEMDEAFPSPFDCDLKVTNIHIEGDEQRNLVVRAYNLLKQDFPQMPRVHAHLYKAIPTQAGMGGGSSDCAAMLLALNEMCQLGLTEQQLIDYAAKLGITEKESEYLWSEHVSTSNTYSEKADSIDILYSDGTIRDISNASEILDLKALTRKPIKRYLFKYRLDPINGTL